jgi:hypothetical protein
MTTSNPQAAWAFRQKQIDRIHQIIDLFPMSDEDGDALAGCLATLMRDRELPKDQKETYQWWNAMLKASHTGCLASNIGITLAGQNLSVVVREELADAHQRLRTGNDMTSRQAGLWGHHLKRPRA